MIEITKPNGRMTGAALRMEFVPASPGFDPAISIRVARQMGIDRFDWDNQMEMMLCFDECARLLQLLRGNTASLCDGKGLFFKGRKYHCVFKADFQHDPVAMFHIEACRRRIGKEKEGVETIHMAIAPYEAGGIEAALSACLGRFL